MTARGYRPDRGIRSPEFRSCTQPTAPAEKASRTTLSVPATDIISTFMVGWMASRARVASAPLVTGICRSINTTAFGGSVRPEVIERVVLSARRDLDGEVPPAALAEFTHRAARERLADLRAHSSTAADSVTAA